MGHQKRWVEMAQLQPRRPPFSRTQIRPVGRTLPEEHLRSPSLPRMIFIKF